MALLLKQIYQNYRYLIIDLPDSRTQHWPLMRSPIPLITIVVIYYMFARIVGPEFMRNKKPYNLRKALIIYNIFQIILNFSLAVYYLPIFLGLNWSCSEVDYSPEKINQAFSGYLYMLVKLVDLLDTVFFVLRKKYNQISFLHIYHHGMIIFVAWIGTKYVGGGHTGFLPYINTCVHVVMYTYYLASIVSNNSKRVIWWKKYITQLQLIQFGIVLYLYSVPLFISNCGYPKFVLSLIIPQNLIMLMLFGDFYYKAYMQKKKSNV